MVRGETEICNTLFLSPLLLSSSHHHHHLPLSGQSKLQSKTDFPCGQRWLLREMKIARFLVYAWLEVTRKPVLSPAVCILPFRLVEPMGSPFPGRVRPILAPGPGRYGQHYWKIRL